MKPGDLVRGTPSNFASDERVGIIIAWARTGGPTGTVWEVLYSDGDTEYWEEYRLELISESR